MRWLVEKRYMIGKTQRTFCIGLKEATAIEWETKKPLENITVMNVKVGI
jgi:DNA-binding XRE family transcriptional regulator